MTNQYMFTNLNLYFSHEFKKIKKQNFLTKTIKSWNFKLFKLFFLYDKSEKIQLQNRTSTNYYVYLK